MGKKKSIMHIDDANQAGALLRTANGGGQGGARLEIGGFSHSPTRSANTITGNDYPHMQRTFNPKDGMFLNMEDAPTWPEAKAAAYTPSNASGSGGIGNNTEKWWDNATQKVYYDMLVESEDPEATMEQWSNYYKHDPQEQENWSKAWTAYTNKQHPTADATPSGSESGGAAAYTGEKIQENELAEKRAKAGQNYPTYKTNPAMQRGIETRLLIKDDVVMDEAPEGGGGTSETYEPSTGLTIANEELDKARDRLRETRSPFKYNAKESPLYGILREQYEREAERASGRAYARATANAGGYGSSYATLAGEEAARQVMEGFDDNQMALYEAARAEYEANRQSAVEDYEFWLQEVAREEMEANEKARIAAGGLTDTQYKAYTEAAQVWNGENKESVQAQLSRMPGMTAADVEAVMNALEADDGAVLADNVNNFKNAPTLSGAASLLAAAKGRDNEAKITAEVQGSMKDAFTAALEDPTSAEVFSLLGMTEEQAAEKFGSITDPDELASAMKAEALNAAGQARVNGLLSGEDYMELMRGEVGAEIASINDKDNENENPAGALGDLVIGLQNYRDAGYVSEEEYNQLLDEVIAQSDLCGIVGRTIDYQVLEDEFWANTADEEGTLGAVMQLIGAVGTIVSTGGTIGSVFLTVAFPPAGIPLLAIGLLGILGSAGINGIGNAMVGDSLLKMATGAIANTVGHNIDIELFEWLAGSSKSQETSQKGLAMLGCVASIPGAGFHALDGLTGGEERTDALRELGLRAYHTQPEEDQDKVFNWCSDWFGNK